MAINKQIADSLTKERGSLRFLDNCLNQNKCSASVPND